MKLLVFHAEVVVKDDFDEGLIEARAKALRTSLHGTVMEDEDGADTNANTMVTGHVHNGYIDKCAFCLMHAQDGRESSDF
jgi:hypothetical protein